MCTIVIAHIHVAVRCVCERFVRIVCPCRIVRTKHTMHNAYTTHICCCCCCCCQGTCRPLYWPLLCGVVHALLFDSHGRQKKKKIICHAEWGDARQKFQIYKFIENGNFQFITKSSGKTQTLKKMYQFCLYAY